MYKNNGVSAYRGPSVFETRHFFLIFSASSFFFFFFFFLLLFFWWVSVGVFSVYLFWCFLFFGGFFNVYLFVCCCVFFGGLGWVFGVFYLLLLAPLKLKC